MQWLKILLSILKHWDRSPSGKAFGLSSFVLVAQVIVFQGVPSITVFIGMPITAIVVYSIVLLVTVYSEKNNIINDSMVESSTSCA